MPISKPHSSLGADNKGSCKNLTFYLDKENQDIDKLIDKSKSVKEFALLQSRKQHFFTDERENIGCIEVIDTIDHNIKKLGKNDAKYFAPTISFSQTELAHISFKATGRNDINSVWDMNLDELNNYNVLIREYIRMIMDNYAENFNRKEKGLNSGADLVYFGKIEHHRKYKGFANEVLSGNAKNAEFKPGLQSHAHLIVSRKDKTQRLKLSPMSNEKSTNRVIGGNSYHVGFDRVKWINKNERTFDEFFKYARPALEKFENQNILKNGSPKEIDELNLKLRNVGITNEVYENLKSNSEHHIEIKITSKEDDLLSKDKLAKISTKIASKLELKENSFDVKLYGKGIDTHIIFIPKINNSTFPGTLTSLEIQNISKHIKGSYNLPKVEITLRKNTPVASFSPLKDSELTNKGYKNFNMSSKSTDSLSSLKQKIIAVFEVSDSLNSFTKNLNNIGITVTLKNDEGFGFTNDKGLYAEATIIDTRFSSFEAIEKLFKNKYLKPSSKVNDLKEKIIDTYKASGNKNFGKKLKEKGIRINVGKEITFINQKGTSVKASYFDKRLTRKAFDSFISKDEKLKVNLSSQYIENIFFDFMLDILNILINSNNELDDSDDSTPKKPKKRKKGRKL